MAEKGSFYKKTIAIAAGFGTLAMLTNPAFAERKKELIDCRTGAYENTEILDVADGEREHISSQPDRLAIISRRRGGVLVEWRNLSYDAMTPLFVVPKDEMATGQEGIYVDKAILKGSDKVHEITVMARNRENTGTIALVRGICPKNAPRE